MHGRRTSQRTWLIRDKASPLWIQVRWASPVPRARIKLRLDGLEFCSSTKKHKARRVQTQNMRELPEVGDPVAPRTDVVDREKGECGDANRNDMARMLVAAKRALDRLVVLERCLEDRDCIEAIFVLKEVKSELRSFWARRLIEE